MELISVRELFKNTAAYADKEVTIGGWVRNRRPSKQFGFIVLNDGTYFNPVQVAARKKFQSRIGGEKPRRRRDQLPRQRRRQTGDEQDLCGEGEMS